MRRRHAIAAWIAGAGVGGVVTARLGDVLRVVLLARRVPAVGRARLAGTLVAEAAGELAVGSAVAAAALVLGVGLALGAGVLVAAAVVGFAGACASAKPLRDHATVRLAPRLRRVLAALGDGCRPLTAPRAYARRVLPWQLGSRALRLAALGCFLAAFHLPVTPQSILLVVIAQGAGSAIPFSPAAATAGAAVMAATFTPLTRAPVPPSQAAAFYVVTVGVLSAIGLASAGAITAAVMLAPRAQPDPNAPLTRTPWSPQMLDA